MSWQKTQFYDSRINCEIISRRQSWAQRFLKYVFSSFFPEETSPIVTITNTESPTPSLVVISRPSVQFTPQPVTIDLSKSSAVPLTLTNGSGITIYSIDESQNSINLSAESSGYVSNSTSSSLGNLSLNQSAVNGDDLEIERNVSLLDQRLSSAPMQSTFSALPMPASVSGERRRTISSNSNRWDPKLFLSILGFEFETF